ncbi:helix-turn-helix transcriptional regulator [Aurantimonas marina]|uniref:helix-turn-helix transcriptional regulator n=1 Tax=Aurantimonas marina TaxID=2780508 RepID=UPI0019D0533D|nr:AlpA family phage regulatory protein [Aurantimonas marina]
MNKLLSIKETCQLTSLSRTSIWHKAKNGQFPKPIQLGEGVRKAFLASEIEAWISQRVAERDEVGA